MTKDRKKISNEAKRLRATDQPCRMDGAVVSVNPVTALPKARGLKETAKKLYLLVACCREMALYQDRSS
ncbi:MAG: hypothetical protein IJ222_10980 [Bacteroidales bacterium]|nr:hypothetical protein [Prevotella sp.]MBQ9311366.1 hypothetical protein [Bacteroidales bacterium]